MATTHYPTPTSSVNGLVHHFTFKYEPVSFMLYIRVSTSTTINIFIRCIPLPNIISVPTSKERDHILKLQHFNGHSADQQLTLQHKFGLRDSGYCLINTAHGNLLRKDLGLKEHTPQYKFPSVHMILYIT